MLALSVPVVVVCCGYFWICGFRVPGGYSLAVENTLKSDTHAEDFERLYPEAEHFISYYTERYGSPVWNSQTLLYGRYELDMQFNIDIRRFGTRVQALESPRFYLNQRSEIRHRGGGSLEITYSGGFDFGLDEWEKLVAGGGDLETILPDVIKDSPIVPSN